MSNTSVAVVGVKAFLFASLLPNHFHLRYYSKGLAPRFVLDNWGNDFQDHTGSVAGWADIPNPGTQIEAGQPIATAWAIRSTPVNSVKPTRIDECSIESERWPEIDDMLRGMELDCK